MLTNKDILIYKKLSDYSTRELTRIYLKLTDNRTTRKKSRERVIQFLELIYIARRLQSSALLFIKYKVNDVHTAKEFCEKYYKKERLPKNYIENSLADINKNGYVLISRHDSRTGETVSFYQKKDDAVV